MEKIGDICKKGRVFLGNWWPLMILPLIFLVYLFITMRPLPFAERFFFGDTSRLVGATVADADGETHRLAFDAEEAEAIMAIIDGYRYRETLLPTPRAWREPSRQPVSLLFSKYEGDEYLTSVLFYRKGFVYSSFGGVHNVGWLGHGQGRQLTAELEKALLAMAER